MRLDPADEALRDAAYEALGDLGTAPPLVTVQFGAASASTLEALGRRGYAVQVPLERVAALSGTPAWEAQPEHVVAVMDGRSVWPDAFDPVRQALGGADDGRTVRLVPSTSLMFLPYTVEGEDLPAGFQFAREKAAALAGWAAALGGGPEPATDAPAAVDVAGGRRARDPRLPRRAPRRAGRPGSARPSRPPPPARCRRPARCATCACSWQRARSTATSTRLRWRAQITDSIAWQERMGLDVLVHGEFERTDMVEYFAEQMDGYLTTRTAGSSRTAADAPVRRSWPHLRPSRSR